MKRLFVIAFIMLFAVSASGATYYVDCNAADDTKNGLSTDNAWKTIGHVNDNTFSAGDYVLFNKGCTWAEAMAFPSSGSAGNPITITSYGSGSAPKIDATGLHYGFAITGKNYVIFDGFEILGGDGDYNPVLVSNSNNNIIRNLRVRDSNSTPYPAIFIYNSSNNTITGNTIDNTYQGISVAKNLAGTCDSNTISRNVVTSSIDNAISVDVTAAGYAGVTNTVIEYNLAYNNKGTDNRAAFGAFNPGAGTIFRYNVAHTNGDATHAYRGFMVDGESGNATATQFYYNISYGNSKEGFAATDNVAHSFYNNVSYQNCVHYSSCAEINLFTGAEAPQAYLIKNNIFYANTDKWLLDTPSGGTTGHTINNNVWYGGAATPFRWGGTLYNWADYRTNSSQDASSYNSDPLFINPTTNFRTQVTSPARDAGANVSLTRDYYGAPVPIGGVQDIGAYEFGACPYRYVTYGQASQCYGYSGRISDRAKSFYASESCGGTLDDAEKCWAATGSCQGSYEDRWGCILGIPASSRHIRDYLYQNYGR